MVEYLDYVGRALVCSTTMPLDGMSLAACWVRSLEGQKFKLINTIFGFHGWSPIEREMNLDVSTVVWFMAFGGICSLIAPPPDVVKPKVRSTAPTS